MENAEPYFPLIAPDRVADGDTGEEGRAGFDGSAEAPPSVFELDLDALLAGLSGREAALTDIRAELPVFVWIADREPRFFFCAARVALAVPEPDTSIPEIRPPVRDAAFPPATRSKARGVSVGLLAAALVAAVAWGWIGGPASYRILELLGLNLSGNPAVNALVERIIVAESAGDPNAKNKRSSATGAGQFLNQTWLELIRAYRPDLAKGSEAETLELRRDPRLAREITTRFAERNAAMLSRRCLPVTPGTLYLSHFAGGSGAVALLLASESDDAATVMAKADKTGRTTRDKIVKANPFLATFTVADIRRWADRKMGNPGMRVVALPSAKPALAFSGEPGSLSPGAEAIRCVQLGS